MFGKSNKYKVQVLLNVYDLHPNNKYFMGFAGAFHTGVEINSVGAIKPSQFSTCSLVIPFRMHACEYDAASCAHVAVFSSFVVDSVPLFNARVIRSIPANPRHSLDALFCLTQSIRSVVILKMVRRVYSR
jgi:hypothetical protein